MKKLLALLLVGAMSLSMVACGGSKETAAETPAETPKTEAPAAEAPEAEAPAAAASEITLWTYPIGNWGDQATLDTLLADFEAATGIKVNVDFLTYADGDDKVNAALEAGTAPDLIMEGPERLVANWGAKGKMVEISDLIDDKDKAELNPAALAACYNEESAKFAKLHNNINVLALGAEYVSVNDAICILRMIFCSV